MIVGGEQNVNDLLPERGKRAIYFCPTSHQESLFPHIQPGLTKGLG